MMLVSIVIPFFNAQATIGETLRAVLSLTPPDGPWEVVLVDNMSRDGSRQVIANTITAWRHAHPERSLPQVRLVVATTRGAYAARNQGARKARGEVLAFTDADCLPLKAWLVELLSARDSAHPIVGGPVLAWPGRSNSERFLEYDRILDQRRALSGDVFKLPFLVTANVAYPREFFLELGGFDESLWIAGDADLAWRAQDRGAQLKLAENAPVFHKHRSNLRQLYNQYFQYGYGWVEVTARNRHRWSAVAWQVPVDHHLLHLFPRRAILSRQPWERLWDLPLRYIALLGHRHGSQAALAKLGIDPSDGADAFVPLVKH